MKKKASLKRYESSILLTNVNSKNIPFCEKALRKHINDNQTNNVYFEEAEYEKNQPQFVSHLTKFNTNLSGFNNDLDELKVENDGFLSKYKRYHDRQLSLGQRKSYNQIFKEFVSTYKNKGYLVKDLDSSKTLFEGRPLLLDNHKIVPYFKLLNKEKVYKKDENYLEKVTEMTYEIFSKEDISTKKDNKYMQNSNRSNSRRSNDGQSNQNYTNNNNSSNIIPPKAVLMKQINSTLYDISKTKNLLNSSFHLPNTINPATEREQPQKQKNSESYQVKRKNSIYNKSLTNLKVGKQSFFKKKANFIKREIIANSDVKQGQDIFPIIDLEKKKILDDIENSIEKKLDSNTNIMVDKIINNEIGENTLSEFLFNRDNRDNGKYKKKEELSKKVLNEGLFQSTSNTKRLFNIENIKNQFTAYDNIKIFGISKYDYEKLKRTESIVNMLDKKVIQKNLNKA